MSWRIARAAVDLPEPELADQPKRLAAEHVERNPVDRTHGRPGAETKAAAFEVDFQIAHVENDARALVGPPLGGPGGVGAKRRGGDLEEAGGLVRRRLLGQRRPLRADRLGERAARREGTARARLRKVRRRPGDRRQCVGARAVETGDAIQQVRGVGVARVGEQSLAGRQLDEVAGIHDGHPVGQAGHHAEIVGDHHQRGPVPGDDRSQQLEDLRLDADVQRCRRLVGEYELRLARERHRNHHALAHAAAELVRIDVEVTAGVGDADLAEKLRGPLARRPAADAEVLAHRLLQLRAHGAHRIQRRHRVLENHRDVLAAQPLQLVGAHCQHVDAVEPDGAFDAGAVGQQAHERQGGHALAGAGLAHHAEHLAGGDVEADAVDGLQRAARGREGDPQIAHRQ